ncbi:MAG: class I SAM-dependent methyltransferase [Caulobacterales bacterium]
MENQTIARPCFICGAAGGAAMFAHDYEVCGLGRVRYALRCCEGCGLVLQDPAVSPQTMARQYAMFSNYLAYAPGDPPLSPTAGRMLQMLAQQNAAPGRVPGRVYDIGASTGAMLWHFRKQGWAVGGCDLSPLAVSQAKALNGVDLDHGDCEATLPGHAGLDLVTLSHVLEHIYEPVSVLAAIRAALAEDGHLLFEVPCLTAPQINPAGLFTMEHVNFFERTSIENLLGAAGFEVARASVTLDHFPYPVITVLAGKAEPANGGARPSGFARNLDFLRAYQVVEQRIWDGVDARLHEAVAQGERVYLWGAGIHTSMLLARTGLGRRARIAAITDRDAQKHGQCVGDYPVVAPEAALASGDKIVVSSFVSEAAIADGLLRQGLPEGRIVRLYT